MHALSYTKYREEQPFLYAGCFPRDPDHDRETDLPFAESFFLNGNSTLNTGARSKRYKSFDKYNSTMHICRVTDLGVFYPAPTTEKNRIRILPIIKLVQYILQEKFDTLGLYYILMFRPDPDPTSFQKLHTQPCIYVNALHIYIQPMNTDISINILCIDKCTI